MAWSTSRLPRRSASPCRPRCSRTPTEAMGGTGSETPRVHCAPRRCGGRVAVRGACAAAQDAARRLCRYAAARGSTLYKFPQADGRTWLSGGPQLYIRLHPNTEPAFSCERPSSPPNALRSLARRSRARPSSGSLILPAGGIFLRDRAAIAQALLERRIPSIAAFRENMEAGALISYGFDLMGLFYDIASYVQRLAAGAKPSDMPIEQSPRFYMGVK